MGTPTLAAVIESYDIGPSRARLNANLELQKFSIDDARRILNCLQPLPTTKGSNHPCGPVYNRHDGFPFSVHASLWSIFFIGSLCLLPIQVGAAVVLLWRGRVRAIWKELPVPTYQLLDWGRDMISFVKAPVELVRASVERGAALCVNRQGKFSVRERDYIVMSHVWGETMGWNTPTAWGPVTLELRRMGLARAHFLRFFDCCCTWPEEWLWVDVLAMPEVLEDMNPAEKEATERLRVGVINCLPSIYTKADKVMVIDTLLLRLSTRSPLDVAVVLCLSFWMTRLWTYTEARLAKKVMLKTRDFEFDLDKIIEFLGKNVLNDQHRYYALMCRLVHLRDGSVEAYPSSTPMESAYLGCQNRYTDVEVDKARVLFPLLGLKWEYGWTLTQGLAKIVEAYPEESVWVGKWCCYRSIDFQIPSQNASSATA